MFDNRVLSLAVQSLRLYTGKVAHVFLGLLFCLLFSLQSQCHAAVTYRVWYVSPLSTGTVHDGKSWKTAWVDFNKIDWSQIQANDIIEIDAGPQAASMVQYKTPLVIGRDDVYVSVSHQVGHDAGTVWLRGPGTTAINVGNHKNVYILGNKWNANSVTSKSPQFLIDGSQGYTNGIYVGPGADYVSISDIRVARCKTGLNVEGGFPTVWESMIDDNAVNVAYAPSTSGGRFIINHTWICNSVPTPTPGIVTGGSADGRLVTNQCIYGPGLSTAISMNSDKVRMQTSESLFLNPSTANLSIIKAPQQSNCVRLWKCTSFMLPLSQQGTPHSCLSFKQPSSYGIYNIDGSIFYGGIVDVVGTSSIGYCNVQFKTSGNVPIVGTTADPLFVNATPASSYANYQTLFKALINMDFDLKPNSPARKLQYGATGLFDAGVSRNNSSVVRSIGHPL